MWYYWFIGGYLAGIIITHLISSLKKKDGVLKIDRTNPAKDLYLLDLDDLDKLHEKKKITLKVDNNAVLTFDQSQN